MSDRATEKPVNVGKLYIRGTISNGAMAGIIALLFWAVPPMKPYCFLAMFMQYIVFLGHGLPQNSEKFYDVSGSATHLSLVAMALTEYRRLRSPRQMFVALASVVWMTRLGSFLYNRILRDGKDGRFDAIKPVWLSFMGAWTMQAMWVTLIQMPVILLNTIDDTHDTSVVDIVLMVVWAAGFLLELVADTEKMVFRSKPENKEKYITTGIWKYSRHPNYCGEILMWSTLALLSSYAAFQTGTVALHAAWMSPAFTALLLLKVSGVPMVERAGLKKWGTDPAYVHYMDNTSCIIPWTPAEPLTKGGKKN